MQGKKVVGIIGFGNMGGAIAQRLKSNYRLWVFDKDQTKTDGLSKITKANNLRDLLRKSEVIILAVKPQDFDVLLKEIKPSLTPDKIFISIAAGIPTAYIEKLLGKVRVIRVMPNMPAKISKGISCLSKGKFASRKDIQLVEEVFAFLGQTLVLEEDMMDAATAVSGSGPGYFYHFLESESLDYQHIPGEKLKDFIKSFKEAATSVGFNPKQANLLVETTVEGSLALLQVQNLSPSELKNQIASKGGTTEAALKILNKGGSLKKAVGAALIRARELAKNE